MTKEELALIATMIQRLDNLDRKVNMIADVVFKPNIESGFSEEGEEAIRKMFKRSDKDLRELHPDWFKE